MSRPNSLTEAFVPFVEGMVPHALSAAFTSSRSATMLASFNGGGAGAAGGAAAAAFAALSAIAAESGLFSPFEQAHSAHTAMSAAPWVTRIDIRPPYG